MYNLSELYGLTILTLKFLQKTINDVKMHFKLELMQKSTIILDHTLYLYYNPSQDTVMDYTGQHSIKQQSIIE